MTFLPRRSLRDTLRPSSAGNVKSGARSPSVNISAPGPPTPPRELTSPIRRIGRAETATPLSVPYSIKSGISQRILYVNGPGSFLSALPAEGTDRHNHGPQGVFSKADAGAAQAVRPVAHREGENRPGPVRARGRRCRPAGPPAAIVRSARPRLRILGRGGVPAQRGPLADPWRSGPGPPSSSQRHDQHGPLAAPCGRGRARLMGRGPTEAGAVPSALRVDPFRNLGGGDGSLLHRLVRDHLAHAAEPPRSPGSLGLPAHGCGNPPHNHLDGDEVARPWAPPSRDFRGSAPNACSYGLPRARWRADHGPQRSPGPGRDPPIRPHVCHRRPDVGNRGLPLTPDRILHERDSTRNPESGQLEGRADPARLPKETGST